MSKSTNKELVTVLQARNAGGRYDNLIQNAKKNLYHDFRSSIALPKLQLAKDLAEYPELADIREAVIQGEYDESMFDEEEEKPTKFIGEVKELPVLPYSPKLKDAMKEIKDVLKKYDIAGVVLIHTPGHGEYLNHFFPSYSCVTLEPYGYRIKAKLKDFGGDAKKRDKVLHDTSNMLSTLVQIAAMQFDHLATLSEGLDKEIGAEHHGGPTTGQDELEN